MMEDVLLDRDRIVDGSSLPDEYFCPICRLLLWNPRSCQSCQRLFCQKCIQTWIKYSNGSRQCPFRCQEYQERHCPPVFISLLSKIEIHCRNVSYGCTEIVSYDSLEQHENVQCKYLTKRCQECMKLVLVSELNEHIQIPGNCIPCPARCVFCQLLVDKDKLKDHFAQCYQTRISNILAEFSAPLPETMAMHQNGVQLTTMQRNINFFQAIQNIQDLCNQQRQVSPIPTTFSGISMVQQAQDRNCGYLYHIYLMIIFILMNWRRAPYIITCLSIIGFKYIGIAIFVIYVFFLKVVSEHIYIGSFILMALSFLSSIAIPYFLQHVTDKYIIFSIGFILVLFGCAVSIIFEVLESGYSVKANITCVVTCILGMLVMKIFLLIFRFIFWYSPIYLRATIFACVNIYLSFVLRVPSA